jgi:glycosyltransferase 2 family protein
MESRAPALEANRVRARSRLWVGLAKTVLGLTLLVSLVFWGKIDLHVLLELTVTPLAVVTCLALLFLAIPVAALRWGILLRALGVAIPFVNLFHFVAIGLLMNVLLLGTAGGDAIRGIYAWRALGRDGTRVTVSVLADRLSILLAVLVTSLAFSLLYWHRMQQVPVLAALGTSIIVVAAICIIGAGVLFAAPNLIRSLEVMLLRWPFVGNLLAQMVQIILMLRASPLSLLAAFALALVTQMLTVFAVLALAEAIKIGVLSAVDYMFAVPLTLIANALPLTPSGIGVGEAAFDQICRWLEPTPSGAAYSSIFFAFRVVSTLTCIPGLISLAIYRNAARSHPPQ